MVATTQWPKVLPPLTAEQQTISDDFMQYWHEIIAKRKRYRLIEKFNQRYAVKHAPKQFKTTLEIGAGLGEHLRHERITPEQRSHYTALELRENMAAKVRKAHPDIITIQGDCQETLPFKDNYFDRVLAIHILEHLPNLPAAIMQLHRVCNKQHGMLSIVIPCEGGLLYSLARKLSAKRVFERRYQQPYQWFIEREHINTPREIFTELAPYFEITHRSYFPLALQSVNANLCIGATLRPRIHIYNNGEKH